MFQTTHLQTQLSQLAEKKWTVIPIDISPAQKLQECALLRWKRQQFCFSKTTDNSNRYRGDLIYWLAPDPSGLLSADEIYVIEKLQQLRQIMREEFRIPLQNLECHFSRYEPGQSYPRHQDTTKSNNQRLLSFVIYLNSDWRDEEGGHLVAYQNDDQVIFRLKPEIGQMVLFQSDLEHEVLPSTRTRLSLTGWFRR